MANFDQLNRETKEWCNRNKGLDHTTTSARYGTSEYWRNYWNNQTYKANNGAYSRHY